MNNLIKKIGVWASVFFVSALFLAGAASANIFDIEYPVPELGNCESQEECKIFCDKEENQMTCMDFAVSKNIIPKEYAQQIRNDLKRFEEKLDDFGPGGCISPRECDAYCRVLDNLDECLDYGVKNGHTTQAEADEIRKQADKGGPGGCQSREECDNFCRQPENSQVCFAFVVEEGKITQEEADFMAERMMMGEDRRPERKKPEINEEKVSEILKNQGGPGGCMTIDECEAYCGGFEHSQECFEFAVENDLMPEGEDIEMARKMSALQSGPGGCMNDKECDDFCSQPKNHDECMRFMKENNLISDEELKMMEREMEIKMKLDSGPGGPNGPNGPGGMDGPGGCRTPEECNDYCSDPAHIEECINFAGQHSGMIDKGTIDNMMGQTQEARDKMMQMEMERRKFEGGEGGFMMMDGDKMDRMYQPREGEPREYYEYKDSDHFMDEDDKMRFEEMKKMEFENMEKRPMMMDGQMVETMNKQIPTMEEMEKMKMEIMPYPPQEKMTPDWTIEKDMLEERMPKEFEIKMMDEKTQMQEKMEMQISDKIMNFSPEGTMEKMPEMYKEFEMGPPMMEKMEQMEPMQFAPDMPLKEEMMNSENPPEFFQPEPSPTGAKINAANLMGLIITPFLNGFLGR